MKKLLSIILFVAMLLTMFAGVTAFAEETEVTADEILTSEGLTIEFVDYTTYPGFKKTETDGNVYMRAGWYEGDNAHLSVSRTISVEQDGYYDIETVMGYTSSAGSYSKIVVELWKDGDSTYTWQLTNLSKGTDVNSEYPSNGTSFPANKYSTSKLKLTKGNYTLHYTVYKCGSAAKFMMDYIKFSFATDETLDGDELTIEAEKYCLVSGAKSTDYANASGGVYVKAGSSSTNPFDAAGIMIKVTTPGLYTLEGIMSRYVESNANCKSSFTLLDSEETTVISVNNQAGAQERDLDGYVKSTGCSYIDLYKSSPFQLNEGLYILKINNTRTGSYYRYVYDSIVFKKYDRIAISSTQNTKIEMEEAEPRLKQPYDNVSNGHTAYSGWTGINKIEIPVTIEKSGYYTIEQLAGKGTSTDYSWWTMYIDDVQYAARTDESVATAADLGYTSNMSALPLVLFRENSKWLTAGDHIIKYEFSSVNGHYGMNMDYLEFIPKGGRRVISAAQPTVIELEDFAKRNEEIKEDSVASGGKFVSQGYGSNNPSHDIYVEVEKAGLYWIEILQGYSTDTGSYGLKYTMMVNDAGDKVGFAYSNNDAGDLDETWNVEYTNYHTIPAHGVSAAQTPMKKFRRLIWLPKGGNTIEVNVGHAANYYKFNMDAITFIPVDGIEVNGDDVTVTANWKTAYTGKAYAALYNGEELVNVAEMDIADASEVKLSLKETDAFDKAKVFVWDVANDNKPLTKARVFTK